MCFAKQLLDFVVDLGFHFFTPIKFLFQKNANVITHQTIRESQLF
jgi:hypothetical protein